MNHRVLLTGAGIADQAFQLLVQNGCLVASGDSADTPEDLIQRLTEFDPHALIVRQGRITAEVQEAAPSLKVICKHGVGLDNIDIEAASRRRIPVLFTPGANYASSAEHTVALMLALLRRIPFQDRQIRNGVFDKKGYHGVELRGKVFGLVGFGRIARRVAELLTPFDVSVLVYHPSSTQEPLASHISKVARLSDLLRTADVVSLHCPSSAETRNLINRDTIAQMKHGVYVVNTARGDLIDETDLLEALQEGRVGGAALDVFAEEPPPADHPLIALDSVISTAHVAGSSDRSLIEMGLGAVRNVLDYLHAGTVRPLSIANPAVLSP